MSLDEPRAEEDLARIWRHIRELLSQVKAGKIVLDDDKHYVVDSIENLRHILVIGEQNAGNR